MAASTFAGAGMPWRRADRPDLPGHPDLARAADRVCPDLRRHRIFDSRPSRQTTGVPYHCIGRLYPVRQYRTR